MTAWVSDLYVVISVLLLVGAALSLVVLCFEQKRQTTEKAMAMAKVIIAIINKRVPLRWETNSDDELLAKVVLVADERRTLVYVIIRLNCDTRNLISVTVVYLKRRLKTFSDQVAANLHRRGYSANSYNGEKIEKVRARRSFA